MILFFLLIIIVIVAIFIISDKNGKEKIEMNKVAQMEPDDRQIYLTEKRLSAARAAKAPVATNEFGTLNPAMVCPHCQAKGTVRKKQITQKKGISGGKATAAVVTGGLSVLAVGLSRKESSTQAHCDNCGNTWHF